MTPFYQLKSFEEALLSNTMNGVSSPLYRRLLQPDDYRALEDIDYFKRKGFKDSNIMAV